jgi:multidrug efflux pump subunit AcrA (membrane-fusion protein)
MNKYDKEVTTDIRKKTKDSFMSVRKGLIITLLMVALSCGKKQSMDDVGQTLTQQAVPVTVMKIRISEIAEQLKIIGDIQPLYQVDIFSKVSGLIRSETAELAQQVNKNQVLAEVQQDIPGMEFTAVKIEATQDGIISMDGVEEGARITPQQKLYTIQQIEQVYMVGRVLESMLNQLKIGWTVPVKVDAFPQDSFSGKIAEISPVVDASTRMGEVKIQINNSRMRLKPGMFARAEIKINNHPGLLVPIDAIIRRGANQYIFKVEGDTAHQIKIETGIVVGDHLEVFDQLQEGERIVVFGQNLLNDLSIVKVVEEITQ